MSPLFHSGKPRFLPFWVTLYFLSVPIFNICPGDSAICFYDNSPRIWVSSDPMWNRVLKTQIYGHHSNPCGSPGERKPSYLIAGGGYL